jgi:predicted O-methyltransferase YrrM
MPVKSFLQDLKKIGKKRNIPNITDETAQFLKLLLLLKKPKNMLEIGSANGFSTIFLADILKKYQGKLVSLEKSFPSFLECQKNLKQVSLEKNVNFYNQDCLDFLKNYQGEKFDAVFIDGQKRFTLNFFQAVLPHLNKKAFIVVDDVIKFAYKMSDFLDFMKKSDYNYQIIKLDEDDGVMFIVI